MFLAQTTYRWARGSVPSSFSARTQAEAASTLRALPVSVTERKEKFTLVFETSWKTACHISATEIRPTVVLEFEGAETLTTTTSLEEEMKELHATPITHLQDLLTMLI